ncbi:MAG: MFS transporter [Promethearchaeota archaeon]
MDEKKKDLEINYSTGVHLSYSAGSFLNDFLSTVLAMWVFKFYETEVFLSIWYITIGIVIYGIWNMVNDPFAGHISDLPIPLTKKLGKRFAWFLITALPTALIFAFIFMPPMEMNEIYIFLWILIILCLFDTLFSFLTINWQSIYPDKFRSQKERTKIGAIQIIMSLIGMVLGLSFPFLIITQKAPGENIPSYFLMGWIVSVIVLITIILMIPGMREDREMIDRMLKKDKQKEKKKNYIEKIKYAAKQKNFVSYLFAYLAQNVVMALLLSSLPYWIQYVSHIDSSLLPVLIFSFLLGSLVSVPLWLWVARKYGNRIGYMFGTGGSAVCLFAGLFVINIIGVFIVLICTGFFMTASWTLLYPCFSDVIDEIVVETGKRDDGIYYGIRTFFGRLCIIIQAITFAILHTITNFQPTSTEQTAEAQFGIVLGMFFVPAIFYMIGFLFMWRVYDLKPEKVQKIKNQLIQFNL